MLLPVGVLLDQLTLRGVELLFAPFSGPRHLHHPCPRGSFHPLLHVADRGHRFVEQLLRLRLALFAFLGLEDACDLDLAHSHAQAVFQHLVLPHRRLQHLFGVLGVAGTQVDPSERSQRVCYSQPVPRPFVEFDGREEVALSVGPARLRVSQHCLLRPDLTREALTLALDVHVVRGRRELCRLLQHLDCFVWEPRGDEALCLQLLCERLALEIVAGSPHRTRLCCIHPRARYVAHRKGQLRAEAEDFGQAGVE
mmetsp:Transcript_57985/g.138041  ORF Transcript_57985/g.138041 Transcript_57985/m.138041 type:complete len:253 (-) Transcript_57985:1240-1998(-)